MTDELKDAAEAFKAAIARLPGNEHTKARACLKVDVALGIVLQMAGDASDEGAWLESLRAKYPHLKAA
jgi:hypothetical protein